MKVKCTPFSFLIQIFFVYFLLTLILPILHPRSNNQTQRLVIRDIAPNPIDENKDFIFHADNSKKMNEKPHKPSK